MTATINSEKERAKQVIIEIIRQSGGGFDLKTNLFKAFYYAHLKYAESNPGYLTHWPVVRMPHGPGIDDFDTLVGELLVEKAIHISTRETRGTCFVLTETGAERPHLTSKEIAAIQDGVQMVDGKSATQVSRESHKSSRSWRNANDGEELNIYIDSIDDETYENWSHEMETMKNVLNSNTNS